MVRLHARPYEASWAFVIGKESADTGHVTLSKSGWQWAFVQDDKVVLKVSDDELVFKSPFLHLDSAVLNDARELESLAGQSRMKEEVRWCD